MNNDHKLDRIFDNFINRIVEYIMDNDTAQTFVLAIIIDICMIILCIPIILLIGGGGEIPNIFNDVFDGNLADFWSTFWGTLTVIWLAITIGRIMGNINPVWPSLCLMLMFFLFTGLAIAGSFKIYLILFFLLITIISLKCCYHYFKE
jgi:hypothetical protein